MSVIDFTDTIIAKSDQLNAADIAGSMTIKIRDAKKLQSPDQPVHIYYEGDNGKPWKPCKTMRRVMAQIWGSKVDLAGRMVTLVNDPKVTWGGAEVGGIRITHMSGIADKVVLPVRLSKTKVEKYTVLPLAAGSKPVAPAPEPETLPDPDFDIDALIDDGNEAAAKGIESYKAFLAGLDDAQKPHIKHMHANWTAMAKAADADEELPL